MRARRRGVKSHLWDYRVTAVARAPRTNDVLGSVGSIENDLRIIRSIGGFAYASADDLAGCLALGDSSEAFATFERALVTLEATANRVCTDLRASPPEEDGLLLGVEALERLMLSPKAGPSQD